MEATNRYITEAEVSAMTGFALSTIRNARFNRTGISYSKFKCSVRYKLEDVVEYMERHRIEINGNL